MTSTRDFTDTESTHDGELDRLRAEVAEWRRRYEKGELRDIGFMNSESDVEPLYTALDVSAESAASLGLTGHEVFDVTGIEELNKGRTPREVTVRADGREFTAVVRIDTPGEADYYRHGGIMQYVLRSLLARG